MELSLTGKDTLALDAALALVDNRFSATIAPYRKYFDDNDVAAMRDALREGVRCRATARLALYALVEMVVIDLGGSLPGANGFLDMALGHEGDLSQVIEERILLSPIWAKIQLTDDEVTRRAVISEKIRMSFGVVGNNFGTLDWEGIQQLVAAEGQALQESGLEDRSEELAERLWGLEDTAVNMIDLHSGRSAQEIGPEAD